MSYQNFTNFSEYVHHNITKVTELGFTSFIADHTMGVAITLVILFILYRVAAESFKDDDGYDKEVQNNED